MVSCATVFVLHQIAQKYPHKKILTQKILTQKIPTQKIPTTSGLPPLSIWLLAVGRDSHFALFCQIVQMFKCSNVKLSSSSSHCDSWPPPTGLWIATCFLVLPVVFLVLPLVCQNFNLCPWLWLKRVIHNFDRSSDFMFGHHSSSHWDHK